MEAQKTVLKKYIESSFYGVHSTVYDQSGEYGGRYYAKNGGLQGMARPLRAALADGMYYDVDMVNAHPVLLEQFCRKNRIECSTLSYYNANRTKVLESISADRETSKAEILRVINGGCVVSTEPFMDDLFREMELVKSIIAEKIGSRYTATTEENPLGSILNQHLCHLENRVLMAMAEVLYEAYGIHPSVLIHDGFMIRKDSVKEDFEIVLKTLEAGVFGRTEYRISLVSKPMVVPEALSKYTVRPCGKCKIHHSSITNLATVFKRRLDTESDLTRILSVLHCNFNSECAVELADWIVANSKCKNVLHCANQAKHAKISWKSLLEFLPKKSSKQDTQACIKFVNTQIGLGEPVLLVHTQKVGRDSTDFVLDIDFKDNYYFVDLCDSIRHTTYNTKEEAIEKLIPDVCRVLFPVQTPECYLLKNCTDEKIRLVKTIPTAYVQYCGFDKATGKDVLKNDLLETFVKCPEVWRALQPINRITFNPDVSKVSKYDFNKFGGFPIENVVKSNSARNDAILYHIKHCWANGDLVVYDYILDWFRQAFLTPWKKTGTVLLLYGEQGAGKGFLLDNLLKEHIYGELCGITAGLDPITQQFNSILMDKLLIISNEVSSEGGFHNKFEKLKALITDPTMTCERKGIDIDANYPNYINFIFTTNNADAVKLGKGDRRYVCLECSDRFKGDYDYFEKLAAACTPENAREFFEFCKARPPSGTVRNIPKTELKTRMMEHSITSVERFLTDLGEYLEEVNPESIERVGKDDPAWWLSIKGCSGIVKKQFRISQSRVYPIYVQYCLENKETARKKHEFKRLFEDVYGEVRKIEGDRVYTLKSLDGTEPTPSECSTENNEVVFDDPEDIPLRKLLGR
jgi:hypothetical protein